MGQHARLAPSNHRWPKCPASPSVEANYPDIPGSAAIDGTGSHLLLEHGIQLNRRGISLQTMLGVRIGENHEDKPEGWVIDQDRINRVQYVLDYLNRRKEELLEVFPGSEVRILSEHAVNPGLFFGRRDDWYGTSDLIIEVFTTRPGESLKLAYCEICDLKDGSGWVEVKENSQLLSYLGGRAAMFPGGETIPCRVTIVQPKTKPVVRYWDTDSDTVIAHCTELSKKAKLTDDPNPSFVPDQKQGKGHCLWCKHKQNCEALANSMKGYEDVKTKTEIDRMSPDELADYIRAEKQFGESFNYAKKVAINLINSGKKLPGYTVAVNTSRAWKSDESIVLETLTNKFGQDYVQKSLCDLKLKTPKKLIEKFPDIQEYLETLLTTKETEPFLRQCKIEESEDIHNLFGDIIKAPEPKFELNLL